MAAASAAEHAQDIRFWAARQVDALDDDMGFGNETVWRDGQPVHARQQ